MSPVICLVLRDVCSFRSCRVACMWIDYVHISNEVSGCGGGDCCGYLLVQGGHDGIYPVYRKTKIGTFLLLLQERGDVEQKALERGLGV